MPLGEPPLPAEPAKNDDDPIPGPHTLLDPRGNQPTINPPFSSDTDPKGTNQDGESNDPLNGTAYPNDVLMGRGSAVQPASAPTVDSARNAVDNALAGTPFDPAGHPAAGLGAQPLSQPLHQTPPPPVPPPLMSSPNLTAQKPSQNKK